jgi:hypothetical protein
MRTNRATTADFAFSSADTKLSRFNGRFFSGIPFPDGFYFAFPAFCETLIAHYRMEEGTHIIGQVIASGPMSGIDYGTAEDDGR